MTLINTNHKQFIQPWERAMLGGLNGWVYSNRTVSDYKTHIDSLMHNSLVLSLEIFEEYLLSIPKEQFATREKFYKATLCFSKYLVQKRYLDGSFLESIRDYRPRRTAPPKRHLVKNDGLDKALHVCQTPAEYAIIRVLSSTGVRASELCHLKLADIDLVACTLVVQCGKWGKTRTLGLNQETIKALHHYLEARNADSDMDILFVNRLGNPMTRHGLHKKLQMIGKRAGVKIHAHALRRNFVTRNANLGRPLQMLQIACGHSNIQTTRSYCLTSEDETVNAMKNW